MMQIQSFCQEYILQTFSKVNRLKLIATILFRASWNFLGLVNIWYHLPNGQAVKKVNFNPCYSDACNELVLISG